MTFHNFDFLFAFWLFCDASCVDVERSRQRGKKYAKKNKWAIRVFMANFCKVKQKIKRMLGWGVFGYHDFDFGFRTKWLFIKFHLTFNSLFIWKVGCDITGGHRLGLTVVSRVSRENIQSSAIVKTFKLWLNFWKDINFLCWKVSCVVFLRLESWLCVQLTLVDVFLEALHINFVDINNG